MARNEGDTILVTVIVAICVLSFLGLREFHGSWSSVTSRQLKHNLLVHDV